MAAAMESLILSCKEFIRTVERELAHFYDFQLKSSAADFLVSKDELISGDIAKADHAGVFIIPSNGSDEVFLGIYFQQEMVKQLAESNPFASLNSANLNSYWTLVEEVSHFHLISNRLDASQDVSKLELEWQGEVDKLLSSAIRLKSQSNDAHYLPLARKLFDESVIHSVDRELYWQATKHAARFWFDIISYMDGIDDPFHSPALRQILKENYYASWLQKTWNVKRASAA
jgi:hypothetical protein